MIQQEEFSKKTIDTTHFLYSQVIKECEGVVTPAYWPEEHRNEWLCTCGQINSQDIVSCCHCKTSHDWIRVHFDRDYLSSKALSHDREETISRQKEREKIKRKKQMKTSLKRGIILIAALSVLVTLVLLTVSVFIPSIRYNEAVSAREQERYLEAAEKFLSLGKTQEADLCYLLYDRHLTGKSEPLSYSSSQYPAFSVDEDGVLHVDTDELKESNLSFSPLVIPDVVDHILVTSIGSSCFMNCTYIEGIVVPDSVVSIEERAFFKCSSMEYIVLPEGLRNISERAFINCSSLKSIVLPEGITAISPRTFNNCSSLSSVIFTGDVTAIKSYAFAGCSSLSTIEIPSSVTEIGAYAFALCDSLTSVIYHGSHDNFLQVVIGENNENLLDKIIFEE